MMKNNVGKQQMTITEIPHDDAISSQTEKLCKVSTLKEKKKIPTPNNILIYKNIRDIA